MHASLWTILAAVAVALGLLFAVALTAWTPLLAVLVVFVLFAAWFVLRTSRGPGLESDKQATRSGRAAEADAGPATTPGSGTAGG